MVFTVPWQQSTKEHLPRKVRRLYRSLESELAEPYYVAVAILYICAECFAANMSRKGSALPSAPSDCTTSRLMYIEIYFGSKRVTALGSPYDQVLAIRMGRRLRFRAIVVSPKNSNKESTLPIPDEGTKSNPPNRQANPKQESNYSLSAAKVMDFFYHFIRRIALSVRQQTFFANAHRKASTKKPKAALAEPRYYFEYGRIK